MTTTDGTLRIWGAGALGGRVGARWRLDVGAVHAYTLSTARHGALRASGIDVSTGSPRSDLTPKDSLLLALPGHEAQGAAIRELAALRPPARSILISSIGVYAGADGTVDEDGPLGTTPRAQHILAVETRFRDWAGPDGVVIRAGGLYAPGRGPYAALRRRGAPPPGPRSGVLGLIHYDDLATAVLAALLHPAPAPCYLAVVPPCPPRQVFYEAACRRAGLSPPSRIDPPHAPFVDYLPRRLSRDLLPAPAHPDWRSALMEPPDPSDG